MQRHADAARQVVGGAKLDRNIHRLARHNATDPELQREPLKPAAGSFSGVLEARRFMSYAGCADQGVALR